MTKVEHMDYQIDPKFLGSSGKPKQVAYAIWDLISIWAVIIAAVALHMYMLSRQVVDLPSWSKPLIAVVTLVVIASRQHALLSLVHEAAHRHFLPGKWNDRISDLLCAFPLLVVTRFYRHYHLLHHRHVNTADDPDWSRKAWDFPKASLPILVRFVGGEAFSSIGRRLKLFAKGLFEHRIYSFILLLHVLCAFLVGWQNYMLFWACPMFFLLPILAIVRSMSEHFGLTYSDDLNQSRDVEAGRLELALFGPAMTNFHLTHHLFPEVPRYKLRELHKKLVGETWYSKGAKRNSSYVIPGRRSVVSDLISRD